MRLVLYFSIIIIAFFSSLFYGFSALNKGEKPLNSALKSLIINCSVLGLGYIWWFLIETDGISQAIGGLIYLVACIIISIVIIVIIYFFGKERD